MATQTLTGNLVRDWRHCENNALKAKFLGSAIAIPVSKRNDEGKLVQSDPDFKDIIVAGPAMKVVAQENILKGDLIEVSGMFFERTNKNGEPERYLSVKHIKLVHKCKRNQSAA